jgi:hypothetical protein
MRDSSQPETWDGTTREWMPVVELPVFWQRLTLRLRQTVS